MLTLVTGQPGNFKTAHTLYEVERLRQESGREVYQSGIPELKLPWHSLEDATAWPDLPDGSIVVIDEAQRVFRVRGQGAAVPPHVSALETHRHRGFDIFLITQHPHLIDTAVRKLAGAHVHMVRRFGLERSNVYRWEEVADPSSETDKRLAVHSVWKPPVQVYGWYKSATVHTVKRNLPVKRLVQAAVAVVVVVGAIAFAAWRILNIGDSVEVFEHQKTAVVDPQERFPGLLATGSAAGLGPWDPALRSPRLDGLLRTAPLYDALQEAKSQPKVAGCMRLDVGGQVTCRCSTSQGSDAGVAMHTCLQLVKDGWFDETAPPVDWKARTIEYLNARDAANGVQTAAGAPPQAAPSAAVSPAT